MSLGSFAASATLALAATAADLEISRKLLDHEARTRAAFTPAQRARVQALESRLTPKMSVAQVTAIGKGAPGAEMFAFMMTYLKMVQKEAREGRKIARTSAELELLAKAGKLDQEKAKIEAEKREASERFDKAMAAAETEMAMGLASTAAAATSAAQGSGSSGPGAARAPADAARLTPTPLVVRAALIPTRTPTKTPGAGE